MAYAVFSGNRYRNVQSPSHFLVIGAEPKITLQ
jgi:hypothetical protein